MDTKRRPTSPRRLAVVAAVIGVLSGSTYAALATAIEHARRRKCYSNLRAIGYGLHMYAWDYEGCFPPSFGHAFPRYVLDNFQCPTAAKAASMCDNPYYSSKDYTPAMLGDTNKDYIYVSGLRDDDPAPWVLAFEDEWNHDGSGVNVLFVGSNVEWVDARLVHWLLRKQEKELAAKGRKMKLLRPAWSSWPDPSANPDPRAGPRPWHARRNRRALIVGALGALAAALVLVLWRPPGWKPESAT